MEKWETHEGVAAGVSTRLFDAATGVLAHEPSGTRVWCVEVRTEETEGNKEGRTYRLFRNGGVVVGAPAGFQNRPEGVPDAPDEPRELPVAAPLTGVVLVSVKKLLGELAAGFNQAGSTNLALTGNGTAFEKAAHQCAGGHAYEVSEALKSLAAGL